MVNNDKELDEIFNALGHEIRRNVIRILGSKGARSFTQLMKDVGVDDSSVLAFHLRKLRRLIRKNEQGDYELTNLGVKAYKILKELSLGEERKEEGKSEEVKVEVSRERKEGEVITISDKISLTLTKDMLMNWYKEGKKVVIEDVIKLIIEPVSREVFKSVIKGIYDVVTVYAPRELSAEVYEKCMDVGTIKFYEGKEPKVKRRGKVSSIIIDLSGISEVLSTIPQIVTKVTTALSKQLEGMILGIKEGEIYISEPIFKEIKTPKNLITTIDIEGGLLKVMNSDKSYFKVLKSQTAPLWDLDIDYHDENEGSLELATQSGAFEMCLEPNVTLKSLSLYCSGGALNVDLGNKVKESVELHIEGGLSNIKLGNVVAEDVGIKLDGGLFRGEFSYGTITRKAKLYATVQGGVLNLVLRVPKDSCVKVKRNVYGGFIKVSVNGRTVSAEYSEECEGPIIEVSIEGYEGIGSVNIVKE